MEVRAGQYWPITLHKLVAFHIDFGHVHIDGEEERCPWTPPFVDLPSAST
jgi:hypothetical protein